MVHAPLPVARSTTMKRGRRNITISSAGDGDRVLVSPSWLPARIVSESEAFRAGIAAKFNIPIAGEGVDLILAAMAKHRSSM